MEKIDLFGSRFILNPPQQKGASRKSKSTEKKKFANLVDSVSEKSDLTEEESSSGEGKDLKEMLEEVEKAGEKLKNSPTMQTVKNYKRIISGFLKDISQKMLQVDEKISGFGIKKRIAHPK